MSIVALSDRERGRIGFEVQIPSSQFLKRDGTLRLRSGRNRNNRSFPTDEETAGSMICGEAVGVSTFVEPMDCIFGSIIIYVTEHFRPGRNLNFFDFSSQLLYCRHFADPQLLGDISRIQFDFFTLAGLPGTTIEAVLKIFKQACAVSRFKLIINADDFRRFRLIVGIL